LNYIVIGLDVIGVIVAILAAWLWLVASTQRERRMTIHETLDYHDFNRLVVSINRTQILNARAAIASAAVALIAAVRFGLNAFGLG
jgi:predicted RND superfamily exporter protein